MSLGRKLLKVATGVALAKGVSTLTKKGLGGGQAGAPGTGSRYHGGKSTGLEDVFSDAIGQGMSRQSPQAGSGNPLDDFLGNPTGGTRQAPRPTTRANALTALKTSLAVWWAASRWRIDTAGWHFGRVWRSARRPSGGPTRRADRLRHGWRRARQHGG